jgi:uncharacterized HAD superfamily protein/hypoxanthine phosphoribosyltransferase
MGLRRFRGRCKLSLSFRSIHDLVRAISRNLHKMPEDVDLIVGVPRSGLMAASILALELNLPFTHLDGFVAGEVFQCGRTRSPRYPVRSVSDSKHALLLDDSILSGGSLAKAKEQLLQSRGSGKLTTAAVFAAPSAKHMVDFYFEICPVPRIFSWNCMHSPVLATCCVDIDGVLCRDPSTEENDDGPRYLEFLRSTEPLRLPSYEVGWLVTSRLERYRSETEAWLERRNVKYRNLVMLENYTAEERRRSGIHSTFKASVYSSADAHLFIESDAAQANRIAQLSGKQVLCVETQQLADPNPVSIPYARSTLWMAVRKANRILRRMRETTFKVITEKH